MTLDIEVKKEDPKTILLSWKGEVWRELSKSLFFNELRKIPRDLSRDDFLKHFSLLEEKIGKRYSVYLLSQRAFLSSDLEAKLLAKGFSPGAAKAVIEYCTEKGFLDDSQEIARLVAKELKKGQSAKAVFFKLKAKKRIDEQQLRCHLQQAAPSDSDALQAWLKKNAKKIKGDDPLEIKKLMAKLCRKGFSYEAVFKAFRDS